MKEELIQPDLITEYIAESIENNWSGMRGVIEETGIESLVIALRIV